MASAAVNRRAILLMLGAMGLFVINDALVKLARETYPLGQVLMLRGGFAIVIALALVFILRDGPHLRLAFRPYVLLRGFVEAAVALLFVWALGLMPIGNLTAIMQASPILIVVLAVLFRIEAIGWRRMVAIAVGFFGVLLIVRPSADGFDQVSLVALAAAVLVAARDLLTRRIGSDAPSSIVSLTSTAAVAACAIVLMPFERWAPMWRIETVYLMGAALLVTSGSLLVIAAYRQGDVGVVSGYRYSIAVFAVAVGYLVWGDIPDLITTLGIATIIASGLYTMHRQRVRPNSQLRISSVDRT